MANDTTSPYLSSRPTYSAIVRAAVDATGAAGGWLLQVDGDHFVVLAAAGTGVTTRAGSMRQASGIAAFVAGSGQPAAVQVSDSDDDNLGAGAAAGRPASLLAVACGYSEVLGVLELSNAVNGAFSFDDVETVSLLAEVAGAALSEHEGIAPPPQPERLAAALVALATTDPRRYREVAGFLDALL